MDHPGVPDREAFWTAVDFLDGRLAERSTVEWALGLTRERRAERFAITFLLHRQGVVGLGEPWVTVWGLIEESWAPRHPSPACHRITRLDGASPVETGAAP